MRAQGMGTVRSCMAAAASVAALLLLAAPSLAGIPECGNIRLEEVERCEVRGNLMCQAGCSEFGVYKTACATKLHTVCRDECTLSPEPTCTDHCTERCTRDCDAGVNIICIHNCFTECVGACDLQCDGAADPAQCRASCEATCDGECDIKCAPLVSGSCYQHCIECCGGSCGAQANMDCQEVCQDRTFEDCEHEFRVQCDASCSADGALFCDGKFVMTGSQIPACVQALADRGLMVQAMAEGEATFTIGPDGSSGGCAVARGGARPDGAGGFLLAMAVALGIARRRRKG